MDANPNIRVRLTVEHWRGGKKLWEYTGGDRVGSPGLDLLANRIGTPDPAGRVRYIRGAGIGTSVAALGTPQFRLGSLVYLGSIPFTKSANTGAYQRSRSFSIGSTYSIRESGLFVGTSKGNLLRGTLFCRGTFPVRNVVSGDTITLNYKGSFTSG